MTRQGATSGSGDLIESAAASRAAGLGPLRRVPETGSTNSDLVGEARAGDTAACVLVADHQTAGRGRLDRIWDDQPGGSLLVSLRIPTSPADAHLVVAAVAAGARAAIDSLVPVAVLVKWPNDLLVVDGPKPGKLAGVLAEFVDGREPVVVVGLGCNIDPLGSHPDSTSLVECGAPVGRDRLLGEILQETGERLAVPDRSHAEIRSNSATLGRRVRVEIVGRPPFTGTAVDLEDDGRLVVEGEDGTRRVVGTGDVVMLRHQS